MAADQDQRDRLSTGKPLSDLAVGPRLDVSKSLTAGMDPQRGVMALAFGSLNTSRRVFDGVEGGALAVMPLILVHGAYAASGLFTQNMARLGFTAC